MQLLHRIVLISQQRPGVSRMLLAVVTTRYGRLALTNKRFVCDLLLEVVGINFGILLPLIGNISVRIDRLDRASGHACAAVDTHLGIDVKLRVIIPTVNAVDGAHVDT